jgi:hypothetical protein
MKTSEDVAEEVWSKLPDLKAHDAEDGIAIIAQALTDYAQEKVRKEMERVIKFGSMVEVQFRNKSRAEGYAAAIEEAAKAVENDCIGFQQEINCLRMEPCQLPHCVEEKDALKAALELMRSAHSTKCFSEWLTLADGAREIFKEMANLSYFDDAEGPELRAQNAMLHTLSAKGLRAFEEGKEK